jgi:hypothetical protein
MVDLNYYAAELQRHQITYETCVGGQAYETIFVVTDEEYMQEMEGFIGYILKEDGNAYFGKPVKFVFDGLIYTSRIEEEEVAEIIGADKLKLFKQKMDAIVALMNAQIELEQQNDIIDEDLMPEEVDA